MNVDAFYSCEELKELGFAAVGKNVQVSRKASIYVKDSTIGDNVRIDDFCILKGRITIGSYVHIAPYCGLSGSGGGITLDDFSGLSNSTQIFTATDDYVGDFLSNPMVPDKYTNVTCGPVYIGKAALVGSGSVILPNVKIGASASLAAFSLVTKNVEPGACCLSRNGKVMVLSRRNVERILSMCAEVQQEQSGK